MGWKILDDDFRSAEINASSALPTPQTWALIYNDDTGEYRVISKDPVGGTWNLLTGGLLPGQTVFYQDGVFLDGAVTNTDYFANKDKNQPTAKAKEIKEDIRRKVNAAYIASGGNAAGKKVHPSAQDPTGPIVAEWQYSTTATPPPGATAVNTFFDKLTKGGAIPTPQFTSANADALFGSASVREQRLLYYPMDILDNQQDVLKITMFKFKPPSAESLGLGSTSTSQKIGDILTKGLLRGSVVGEEQLDKMCVLPIPNNVADSNAAMWGDSKMNNVTAAATASLAKQSALGLMGILGGGGLAQATTGMNPTGAILATALAGQAMTAANSADFQTTLRTMLTSSVLKQAGMDVSPEEILGRGLGIVPNSNMELLFKGVQLRSFSFGWKMSPRSKEEARNVRRIIRMFKQGMAAKKVGNAPAAGSSSYFLGSPNVFKLSYRTANDKPIPGLNRFKPCALTSFAVNYSPEGQWAAFDEGQPVSVTIGMEFTELEPVYENDYQENITDGLMTNVDLDEITADDVGY